MKKASLQEAIGHCLLHDITEVTANGSFKGVAFHRGHQVRPEDLPYLHRLGKEHVWLGPLPAGHVHEDNAAQRLAPQLAGPGIHYDQQPREGKISFYAHDDGLFQVDTQRLAAINGLGIPSLPTLHTQSAVRAGQQVAAFRIIPLSCPEEVLQEAEAQLPEPLLRVAPYRIQQAALLATGNEVYSGQVPDRFLPLLQQKLQNFHVPCPWQQLLPDDIRAIQDAVAQATERFSLVLIAGGTSVDPDDVTRQALEAAGVELISRGNPLQPGNNLSLGRRGQALVCAVPAAALFYPATALDVFLPRLLAQLPPTAEEIAASGHGGLCHFCQPCHFPICPFGRPAC